MDKFLEALNDILYDAYRNIIKLEEKSLQRLGDTSLSINEMHLIEIIKKYGDAGTTLSLLADKLRISRPSVTVAVDKLVKKGYAKKENSSTDGRKVFVMLTDRGIKIDEIHKEYHKNMVEAVSNELTETEKHHLIKGIYKLNNYFVRSIGENK